MNEIIDRLLLLLQIGELPKPSVLQCTIGELELGTYDQIFDLLHYYFLQLNEIIDRSTIPFTDRRASQALSATVHHRRAGTGHLNQLFDFLHFFSYKLRK